MARKPQRPTRKTVAEPLWTLPPASLQITFVPEVQKIIEDDHYDGREKDPFESRRMQMQAKVSTVIACIEHTQRVTQDIWKLAGMICDTSANVHRWLEIQAEEAAEQARAQKLAERIVSIQAGAVASRNAEAMSRRDTAKVLAYVDKHGGCSRRTVKKNAFFKTRRVLADHVINGLIESGQLIEEGGKLRLATT
jgi:hypothetical protein